MMQNLLFSSAPVGTAIASVLTSIIGTITAANIVGVMNASKKNWASVGNYVELILRLKKRDLEAVQHVGVPT